jgi:hypothetical protein
VNQNKKIKDVPLTFKKLINGIMKMMENKLAKNIDSNETVNLSQIDQEQ